MNEIDKNFENVKTALISIGFSAEAAENQIKELGDLVEMAIFIRITKDKPEAKNITPENFVTFLEDNYTQEEMAKIIDEEIKNVVSDYIQAIIQPLGMKEKDVFFSKLKEIAQS